ncbi:antitoxin Xre/MbcA/ParS toxin-binding domain-containing protein [Roseateles sp. BYS78W]|uniref:Antitoxin Xre/MbcA/ParS toxin-binding domain-containing protein n=1 Tax=Pelomonas candidula TaxID=3299025 RepID=A0ABW7HJK6_9BURK
MPEVQTHPQIRDLGTVEAARKVLRAFFNIARAWQLTPGEQEVLLGVSQPTCYRWRNDQVASALSGDTLERLGYILNIYAALQILLPIQERADAWVRQPNTAPLFGGGPALKRMLGGRVGDLKVVADYLDAMRGGEFS